MDDAEDFPNSEPPSRTITSAGHGQSPTVERRPGRALFAAVSRRARRRWTKIVIDTALLGAFVVVFFTREPSFDPDYLLHSWVGLGLVPVLFVHLAGNSGWITRVARNRSRDREARLGAVNLLLAFTTFVCIVSGVPLWLDWTDAAAVSTAHVVTGVGSIFIVIGHLAMNRRRIVSLASAG